MPQLSIFRSSFVEFLRVNIGANLAKYQRDHVWVTDHGTRGTRDIETGVQLKGSLELDEPEDGNLKDLENAIRVHKALGHITPLQARDPRLWTRIAHVDAWRYMRKRWPVERHNSDAEKASRYIGERYLVLQSQGRALLRNGIARLWWTAHLSHDPSRTNPYELTAVLLYTLDITQQILERNMGRSPVVVTGFLEFLSRNRDTLLQSGDQCRERVRKLAKFLNMYGGVCLLDCLSQNDIIKLLGTELDRVLGAEKNRKKASKATANAK